MSSGSFLSLRVGLTVLLERLADKGPWSLRKLQEIGR
jgi:hypothetical protein